MNIGEEFLPLAVLLKPDSAFRGMASGRVGWGWPLLIFALAAAASALQYALLPPGFLAAAFDEFRLPQGRGFGFLLACSLGGGLFFSALLAAVLSALARALSAGRLAPRIAGAAMTIGLYGFLAAALHAPGGGTRLAGLAAAAAAAVFAAWSAWSDRARCAALLKALLAITALSLLASLAGGLAALAGSPRAYAGAEYLFALLSLYWLARAVGAIYGAPRPRAAAAAVLSLFAGLALLFLAFNLGLIPEDVFQALMLG